MLSPKDILRYASTRYPSFLQSIVNDSVFFPLPIRFGRPSATENFDKLRREITALTKANLDCHIEWIEVNSRRWGKQRLPERVEFMNETSYLSTLGKTKEVSRFRENLMLTRERCPSLVSFIELRPLDVIEFADVWPGLLEVCCYFQRYPRPMLYARELPLTVDTKFIENHQTILTRLLYGVLPQETIVEANKFEERFGLRLDEPLIRLRILDESLKHVLQIPFTDFSIPLSCFHNLDWRDLQVVVSENKMTFLTLPSIVNGIGLWGAGNAAALFNEVRWLSNCHIFYWGDLDTQGLEILSRLRKSFPHTESLMMDAITLHQFQNICSTGTAVNNVPPSNLTASEMEAWLKIQVGNLRLEQERIPSDFICKTILETTSSKFT